MQNQDSWSPTKFVRTADGVRGSRDPAHLRPASRLVADAVAERLESALRVHAHGRLADLGCGLVPLYGVYRDLVDEVMCVDWTPNPYLDAVVDLAQPLPFDDDHFDTVVLSDVLEHVPRQEQLLTECHRILRPGGVVVISVPFLYALHEVPHDYFRPTEFGLRWLAAHAGLEVVSLEAVGGSVEVLGDLVGKHLSQVPGVGDGLAAGLQSTVRWFGTTRRGQRLASATAPRLTSGYVAVLTAPPEETSTKHRDR